MRATYVWLSRLIALGVVLQAAFIAFGTFDIFKTVDDGRAFTGEFDDYNAGQAMHSMFGTFIIPLLALIMLIISFFAGIRGGVRLAAAVFGLVVLQFVLALVSFSAPWVGLLHGLNAFAMAALAGYAGQRAGEKPAAVPGPEAAAAA
jgi:amino acid transporter